MTLSLLFWDRIGRDWSSREGSNRQSLGEVCHQLFQLAPICWCFRAWCSLRVGSLWRQRLFCLRRVGDVPGAAPLVPCGRCCSSRSPEIQAGNFLNIWPGATETCRSWSCVSRCRDKRGRWLGWTSTEKKHLTHFSVIYGRLMVYWLCPLQKLNSPLAPPQCKIR